jgi:hypothetical protein
MKLVLKLRDEEVKCPECGGEWLQVALMHKENCSLKESDPDWLPAKPKMLVLKHTCGRCTIKYDAIDDPIRCKEHRNFCSQCDAEVHNVRLSLPPELDHSNFLVEGMIGEIEDA